MLARISRAVARNEISRGVAHNVVQKVISEASYTPESAFKDSIEQADFEHSLEQVVERLIERLQEHRRRGYQASASVAEAINRLKSLL